MARTKKSRRCCSSHDGRSPRKLLPVHDGSGSNSRESACPLLGDQTRGRLPGSHREHRAHDHMGGVGDLAADIPACEHGILRARTPIKPLRFGPRHGGSRGAHATEEAQVARLLGKTSYYQRRAGQRAAQLSGCTGREPLRYYLPSSILLCVAVRAGEPRQRWTARAARDR